MLQQIIISARSLMIMYMKAKDAVSPKLLKQTLLT